MHLAPHAPAENLLSRTREISRGKLAWRYDIFSVITTFIRFRNISATSHRLNKYFDFSRSMIVLFEQRETDLTKKLEKLVSTLLVSLTVHIENSLEKNLN